MKSLPINLGKWIKKLPPLQKYFLLACSALAVISFSILFFSDVVSQGPLLPSSGGEYREGIIGVPQYINPILSPANEVDRTLIKLIYPSLLSYDVGGNIIPSLAKDYAVGDFGKVYDVTLRENAVWEDGVPITADDIIFTIELIQNSKTASPLGRVWNGVKVDTINDKTIRFALPTPYVFFLQNLTIGILPKHIWQKVDPEKITLALFNKKPIGGGPYQVEIINEQEGVTKSITLKENPLFFGEKPFLSRIAFFFYADSKQLLEAYQKNEVDGIPLTSLSDLRALKEDPHTAIHAFLLPRYFAVFLNDTHNKSLVKKGVRQALLSAIDKEKIIQNILQGQGVQAHAPITSALTAYYDPTIPHDAYNPEKARDLLETLGFSKNPLSIELTIINNDSLTATAKQIIQDWQAVGVNATLREVTLDNLRKEILEKRDYQAFLFGQGLALEPDPFSLWHSSQGQYPGLNLSSYSNPRLDALLEELRKTFDEQKRKKLFKEFQTIMTQDVPALFLYSPYQLFIMHTNIQGVRNGVLSLPEDRFNQISQWYINTKRAQ